MTSQAAALAIAIAVVQQAGAAIAEPADPCRDVVGDPIATPLREGAIDGQRAACVRSELSADVTAHTLIDSANFHGVVGGGASLTVRFGWHRWEFGAHGDAIDYTFTQTAVNKASDLRIGPLVATAAITGAFGDRARIAAVATWALPYTRDDMATQRTGGELAAVVTGALTEQWTVHGRLAAVGALAWSQLGTSQQLGLRGGADVVRKVGARASLLVGGELGAGWNAGFDGLLIRAGLQMVVGARWRPRFALGVPVGGNEQANVVVAVGLARDWR